MEKTARVPLATAAEGSAWKVSHRPAGMANRATRAVLVGTSVGARPSSSSHRVPSPATGGIDAGVLSTLPLAAMRMSAHAWYSLVTTFPHAGTLRLMPPWQRRLRRVQAGAAGPVSQSTTPSTLQSLAVAQCQWSTPS